VSLVESSTCNQKHRKIYWEKLTAKLKCLQEMVTMRVHGVSRGRGGEWEVFEKEWFLSWEWKSEGVMDDVSGYSHWLSLWITAIARSRCPLRAPVRNVPLIQFLISVLYIVCLFMSYASLLIFFLHFFLTYLLPYLSFSSRIDPLRFQAGCLFKRRLNLALVFFVFVL